MFCTTCGSQLVVGSAFCTNCGTPASPGPKVTAASNFPVQSPPQQQYQATQLYAQQPSSQQIGYTNYAQPGQFFLPPKTKTAAVLLAVFLSGWTWLYTYRADAPKFWVSLGVGSFLFLLSFAAPVFTFFGLGFWIWAIVDTASKTDEWYASYWNRYTTSR